MIQRWLVVTAMISRLASADDRPTYLAGVGFGGPGEPCCGEAPFPTSLIAGLLFAEGAYRVSAKPFYIHAMVKYGRWEIDQVGGGPWLHVRAGGEFRGCSHGGGACLIIDDDIGYLAVFDLVHDVAGGPEGYELEPIPTARGLTFGGRIGLDTGSRHIRFRMAIDLSHAVTGNFDAVQNRSTNNFGTNGALELGLAAAF